MPAGRGQVRPGDDLGQQVVLVPHVVVEGRRVDAQFRGRPTAAAGGVLLGVGVAVLGTGLGFGLPGIMSAPTLLAAPGERSAVAGLVSASTALTFVVGSILGNGPYG